MKKLLFILMLCVSFSYAQTTIWIGQELESTDTLEHEVALGLIYNAPPQLLYILIDEDNTSTVKFSVGTYPPIQDQYPFPAGSKIPISIRNGSVNLRYKAQAVGQKFVITN